MHLKFLLVSALLFSSILSLSTVQIHDPHDLGNKTISNDHSEIDNLQESQEILFQGPALVHNSDLNQIAGRKLKSLTHIPYTIVEITNGFPHHLRVYPNQKLAFSTPTQESLEIHDYHDDIEIQEVWDQGYDGSGIVVSVIDTGINFNHPSLVGKKVAEKSFHAPEYGYEGSKGPADDHGHGTAVASLVAGHDPGQLTAPGFGAKLINAKIGLEDGFITTLSVLGALDWSIGQEQVDIVTMSLSEAEEGFDLDPLEELVEVATKQGIVVVGSAGNRGSSGTDPHTTGSPGTAPTAISIGSVDNNQNLASFSSEGPSYGDEAKPDFVAPGTSIKLADRSGGYNSGSGTSFSTPIISGVIAALLHASNSESVDLTAGQLKSALARSATDLGYSHYQQGFGLINSSAALDLMLQSQFQPVIAPSTSNLPEIELPVQTSVFFPISLIGFSSDNFEIASNTADLEINHAVRYKGSTSVIVLELVLKNNKLITSIHFTVSDGSKEIQYSLPVKTLDKPEFKVLLDLKHTPFDSMIISPKNDLLDRLDHTDILPLQAVIEQNGGWITEFYGTELTYSILKNYDMLWMPSAFGDPQLLIYDHRVQSSDLELSELFALYEFYHNGGSILMDFDGSSIYEDIVKVNADPDSLAMMAKLMGVNLIDENTAGEQNSIDSVLDAPVTSVPSGTVEFGSGIPLVEGESQYAAIGLVNEAGGKLVAHNSRNWRDTKQGSQIKDYQQEIISWLSTTDGIQTISVTDNSLQIQFTEIDLSNVDVEVLVNGVSHPSDLSGSELMVSNLSPLDRVDITVADESDILVKLDQIIPVEEYTVHDSSFNQTDGFIELSFNLNSTVSETNSMRLLVNDIAVDASILQDGNVITVLYTTDELVEPEDLKLQFIDSFGRLTEFTHNPQDPETSNSRGIYSATVTITFLGLFIALTFLRKIFREEATR